ncbi:hypothetical protein HMPREF1381_00797 [Enterococcus faecium R501]|nr:hypothetical protein HMPREF1381_00797 [Enterococcus faecium R501]
MLRRFLFSFCFSSCFENYLLFTIRVVSNNFDILIFNNRKKSKL